MCGIVKLGLSHERQDQIINRSHDLGCVSNRHAGGIFLERDLAALVQAGLNAPMGSAGQAGDAEFYFTRSAVAVSITSRLELALQAIDLRQPGPSRKDLLFSICQATLGKP